MALDFDSAIRIWNEMRNTKHDELLENVIDAAIRYARMRVDYLRADPEHQGMLGSDRAAIHNGLISHLDVLARMMRQTDEIASWRDHLGNDRKNIGDFACWLHAGLGVSAR